MKCKYLSMECCCDRRYEGRSKWRYASYAALIATGIALGLIVKLALAAPTLSGSGSGAVVRSEK